jgi:hypothetical protein
MAKKLFGLSMFLWILIALVVLFFVYGVGRREGFYAAATTTCSSRSGGKKGCTYSQDGKSTGCTWTPTAGSDNPNANGTCS